MDNKEFIKLLEWIVGSEDLEDYLKYLPNIDKVISTLPKREQFVLIKQLQGKTLKEIGISIPTYGDKRAFKNLSTARIAQIKAKALRRMRHLMLCLRKDS